MGIEVLSVSGKHPEVILQPGEYSGPLQRSQPKVRKQGFLVLPLHGEVVWEADGVVKGEQTGGRGLAVCKLGPSVLPQNMTCGPFGPEA